MPRKYASGSLKRKRKELFIECKKKLSCAMEKFVVPKENAKDNNLMNSAATATNTIYPREEMTENDEKSELSATKYENNLTLSDKMKSAGDNSDSLNECYSIVKERNEEFSINKVSVSNIVNSENCMNEELNTSDILMNEESKQFLADTESSLSSSTNLTMKNSAVVEVRADQTENLIEQASYPVAFTSNEVFSYDIENEKTEDFDINNLKDPASWPPITDALREFFIQNKPDQNLNYLPSSKKCIGNKERMCSETNFLRTKKNGEVVRREWLIYSPSLKAVFCYICKLYSSSDQALCKEGYSDWRNISKRLSSHENSDYHRTCMFSFSQRSVAASRINSSLIKQYTTECEYWKKILHRVVAVIKFISQRGLACFGKDETFGSVKNGNFLGILELLSLFDPVLANHIKNYGNKGKGNANYLSSTTVTEIVEIMSNRVLKEILKEIQDAKYFGLIVDSTPDITHVDQLAIVLRYVDKKGDPVERFVKFIAIHGHSSQHLKEVILNFLQTLEIDLKFCRGQSFDNASNMSGKYSGLQARLKNEYPLIEYVPCSAHSLNLVGSSAVECCHSAVSFFGIVQTLYNYFSASTHRWNLLSENVAVLTLKSLSGTRWSANADAVKALRKNYDSILKTLDGISNNENETASSRHEAKSLHSKITKFENALLTVIWDRILQRMNNVSKTVQSENCEMSVIVPLYESLIKFIQYVRNNFDEFEIEAEALVGTREYATSRNKKVTRSKMLDESSSKEIKFSEREQFLYQVHYVICDSLVVELEKRKSAYAFVESRFGFMCNKSMSDEKIKACSQIFQETYSDDIDDDFPNEFLQFNAFISKDLKPIDKLKEIKSLGIEHTFPNVETALRIMLSIPITNCSSERSFSALKRIKSCLRSSLSENKLSGLALLAIESDLTEKVNFDDIIDEFAKRKMRRKDIQC